jgi:hypothetical protein
LEGLVVPTPGPSLKLGRGTIQLLGLVHGNIEADSLPVSGRVGVGTTKIIKQLLYISSLGLTSKWAVAEVDRTPGKVSSYLFVYLLRKLILP